MQFPTLSLQYYAYFAESKQLEPAWIIKAFMAAELFNKTKLLQGSVQCATHSLLMYECNAIIVAVKQGMVAGA